MPAAPCRHRFATMPIRSTFRTGSTAQLWSFMAAIRMKAARARLGASDGAIAPIGGTEVFSMFLPVYDAFHLTRAAHAKIPGGRPVFAGVGPNLTPEDLLARHGLKPGPRRDLDAAAGITLVTWERAP